MQGLYNGKSLSPNDGVLAPLMKHLLESMMDGELEVTFRKIKLQGTPIVGMARPKRLFEVLIPVYLSLNLDGIDRVDLNPR